MQPKWQKDVELLVYCGASREQAGNLELAFLRNSCGTLVG
jgi:hypothetical protein